MSDHVEIAELILGTNDKPTDMWRQGVVTAVTGNTVTVQIGGTVTAVAGIRHFTWYAPVVNDVVHLLPYGKSFIALGKLA